MAANDLTAVRLVASDKFKSNHDSIHFLFLKSMAGFHKQGRAFLAPCFAWLCRRTTSTCKLVVLHHASAMAQPIDQPPLQLWEQYPRNAKPPGSPFRVCGRAVSITAVSPPYQFIKLKINIFCNVWGLPKYFFMSSSTIASP